MPIIYQLILNNIVTIAANYTLFKKFQKRELIVLHITISAYSILLFMLVRTELPYFNSLLTYLFIALIITAILYVFEQYKIYVIFTEQILIVTIIITILQLIIKSCISNTYLFWPIYNELINIWTIIKCNT